MTAEATSFRSKVLKGFVWLSAGTFVGQFISWASTLVIVRLLSPKDYGLMAMAASFSAFLSAFSELGLVSSIVQAEKVADEELRQLSGFSIMTSTAAWAVCVVAAPLVAQFYKEEHLVPLLRVIGLNFFLIALYVVPQALFIREMNFKAKAKVELVAQLGSVALSLAMALSGLGVWALVAGTLALNAIKVVGFNVTRSPWLRPRFQYRGIERYVKYGSTLMGSRLFYSLYNQSDMIVVGKVLGRSVLGVYAVALNLASIPADKVLPLINTISFTSYSRIQGDMERVRKNVLRTTRALAFVGFPLFFGMAGVADEAIPLILGQKWVSIVGPFKLLCLVLPLKALSPILASTQSAVGQARMNLTNTALTGAFMVAAFLVGVQYGIVGVCWAWVAGFPVISLLVTMRNLRGLGIGFKSYLGEVAFPFCASTVMLVCIAAMRHSMKSVPVGYSLGILVAAGAAIYGIAVILFRRADVLELRKYLVGS